MLAAGAPSQAKRTPDFGRYLPLSGEKVPRVTRPQVYRVVREMLPMERFGPEELLLWLEDTQLRNERARRSHERRRSTRREDRMEPPP